MSFYNRVLAQMVQKYVDLQGNVEPLDVVTYGGADQIQDVVGAGATVTLLPPPSAGAVYAIKTFSVFNSNSGAALVNSTGKVIAALPAGFGSVPLAGQIIATSVGGFNNGTAPCTIAITYDIVTTPSIS